MSPNKLLYLVYRSIPQSISITNRYLGLLVQITMMERLFELEKLNLYMAMNILYGLLMQLRVGASISGLHWVRGSRVNTVFHSVHLFPEAALLPSDCFCLGPILKRVSGQRSWDPLSIISCDDALKRGGALLMFWTKREKKALTSTANLGTGISKLGHTYKSVITRSHIHSQPFSCVSL